MTYKQIEGFPDYAVSDEGCIMNTITGRELTPKDNGLGYMVVSLWKNNRSHTRTVASLVAKAFIPCVLEGAAVAYNVDGDKNNNRVENLEWRSRSSIATNATKKTPIGKSGERYIYHLKNKYRVVVHRVGFKRERSFDSMKEAKAYRRELLGF